MVTSKFLHFFNPMLFPIYDDAIIWQKVCWEESKTKVRAAFRSDYEEFCLKHGFVPKDMTAKFNLNYTLWASELVRNADKHFMNEFATWFQQQVSDRQDKYGLLDEINQYYAIAFEFTAIGAACLEFEGR